ncbi:hypothetical protein LTR66_008013 [Elasticomyces elasticus]|nr:hypothetical protein LTR66_008013 [Elasticomyces elasticus]
MASIPSTDQCLVRQPTVSPATEDTSAPTLRDWTLEEFFDIWEHASLLFHSYEWEQAIHNFHILSSQILHRTGKAAFDLNVGIVHCHLGEYGLAAEAFKKAAVLDPELALAHFLLGIANYELKDLLVAELAFESCLLLIPPDWDVVDNKHIGLDFELARVSVQRNKKLVSLAIALQRNHHGTRPLLLQTLDRLPAGKIFEPPQELESNAQRSDSPESSAVAELACSGNSALYDDAKEIVEARSRIRRFVARVRGPHVHRRLQSQERTFDQGRPGDTLQNEPSDDDIMRQPSPELLHRTSDARLRPDEDVLDAWTGSREKHLFGLWKHQRGRAAMFNVRGSVTDRVADLVHGEPYNKPTLLADTRGRKSILEPREARVHYESLRELSAFIRHSGPNRGMSVALSLMRDDSPPRQALTATDPVTQRIGSPRRPASLRDTTSAMYDRSSNLDAVTRLSSAPSILELASLQPQSPYSIAKSGSSRPPVYSPSIYSRSALSIVTRGGRTFANLTDRNGIENVQMLAPLTYVPPRTLQGPSRAVETCKPVRRLETAESDYSEFRATTARYEPTHAPEIKRPLSPGATYNPINAVLERLYTPGSENASIFEGLDGVERAAIARKETLRLLEGKQPHIAPFQKRASLLECRNVGSERWVSKAKQDVLQCNFQVRYQPPPRDYTRA